MHKEAFSHLHRLFDGVRSVQSQPPKYSRHGSQFCSISLSPSPLRIKRSVPSGVEFGASAMAVWSRHANYYCKLDCMVD